MSITAEAEVLGVSSASHLKDCFLGAGAATYFAAKASTAAVAAWVDSITDPDGDYDGVAILRPYAQDETTFRFRGQSGGGLKDTADVDGLPKELCQVVALTREQTGTDIDTEVEVTKIMQCELVVAFLIRRRSDGKFLLFFTELPVPLLTSDKGTAEQLVDCIGDIFGVPLVDALHQKFGILIDLANGDRGATGLRAERLLDSQHPTRLRLHGVGCFAHIVHTSQKHQCEMLNDCIAGCIAWAETLKFAGKRKQLRRIVRDLLIESAVPRLGTAPPAADSETMIEIEAVLSRCLNRSQRHQHHRYLRLLHCFRSPLTESKIHIYMPNFSTNFPLDMIRKYVRSWATQASKDLVGTYPTFQRGRWVTNTDSLGGLGLLASCYRLLERAAPRFLGTLGGSGPEREDMDSRRSDESQIVMAAQTGASAEYGSKGYWAEISKRHKGDAFVFASSGAKHVLELLMLVIVLPLHAALMTWILHVDSEKWQQKQDRLAIDDPAKRTYRALMAATGQLTADFHKASVQYLCSASEWTAVSLPLRTYAARSLAFGLLAKAIGCIAFLIDVPCAGYPWRLFRLLDPTADRLQIIEGLLADPPCLWDPFAKQFFTMFGHTVEALSDPKVSAILMAIAILFHLTIARVEARHASVRRNLRSRGTTWLQELASVSSDFVLMRNRILELRGKRLGDKLSSFIRLKYVPSGKWSHAGPARAFVSEFLGGNEEGMVSADRMRSAMAAYNRIKADNGDEYRRLLSLGQQGVIQGRQGFHAFPKRVVHQALADADDMDDDVVFVSDSNTERNQELAVQQRDCLVADSIVPVEVVGAITHVAEAISAASKRDAEKDRQEQLALEAYVDVQLRQGVVPLPWDSFPSVRPRIIPPCPIHDISVQPVEWVNPAFGYAERFLANADLTVRSTLDKHWSHLHRVRRVAEYRKLKDQAYVVKLCFFAGFCVCNVPLLRFFVDEVRAYMRRMCAKDKIARPILDMNALVLRISSDVMEGYYHISHTNLTTMRAAVLLLLVDTHPLHTRAAEVLGRKALVVDVEAPRCAVSTWWQALSVIDLQVKQKMILMQLSSSQLTVRDFSPKFVVAERVCELVETKIWGGPTWFVEEVARRKELERERLAAKRAAKRARKTDVDKPAPHQRPKRRIGARGSGRGEADEPPLYAVPILDGDPPDDPADLGGIGAPDVPMDDDDLDVSDGERSHLSGSDRGSGSEVSGPDDAGGMPPPPGAGAPLWPRGPPSGAGPSPVAVGPADGSVGVGELPPPPAPAPKVQRMQRGKWNYVAMEGGWLVYDALRMGLNAHCTTPGHSGTYIDDAGNVKTFKCHFDKSTGGLTRRVDGSGRVAALESLWLSFGSKCATRAQHQALKSQLPLAMYWGDRRSERDSIKDNHPCADEIFEAELPKDRESDDSEPPEIP